MRICKYSFQTKIEKCTPSILFSLLGSNLSLPPPPPTHTVTHFSPFLSLFVSLVFLLYIYLHVFADPISPHQPFSLLPLFSLSFHLSAPLPPSPHPTPLSLSLYLILLLSLSHPFCISIYLSVSLLSEPLLRLNPASLCLSSGLFACLSLNLPVSLPLRVSL